MNTNLTEIAYVLDRSGSMSPLVEPAIRGFNEFLQEQMDTPGDANLSLLLFDDEFLKTYDRVPIEKARGLTTETYVPRGCTALLDAIGITIDTLGKQLSDTPEPERPGKVVVAIFTDGYENSSTKYDLHKIQKMITHQRKNYQWEFLFLGANEDAIATATQIGIDRHNVSVSEFSERGIYSSSKSVSRRLRALRKGGKNPEENPDLYKSMDDIVREEESRE